MSDTRPPGPRLIARGRTRVLSRAELEALTKDQVAAWKLRKNGGPLRPGIRGAGTVRSHFEPLPPGGRPGVLLLLESLASVARRIVRRFVCWARDYHDPERRPVGGQRCRTCGKVGNDINNLGYVVARGRPWSRWTA